MALSNLYSNKLAYVQIQNVVYKSKRPFEAVWGLVVQQTALLEFMNSFDSRGVHN